MAHFLIMPFALGMNALLVSNVYHYIFRVEDAFPSMEYVDFFLFSSKGSIKRTVDT